jgi:hypothetical protein
LICTVSFGMAKVEAELHASQIKTRRDRYIACFKLIFSLFR